LDKVRIVTDSAVRFENRAIAKNLQIDIVPLQVHVGDQTFKEGVELDSEELFYRMRHGHVVPRITPPPVEEFETLFEDLSKQTRQICVLTHSRHLSKTWDNANEASKPLLGRCEIPVIDSMTTSVGLGILVETVAKAAADGARLEEVVRIARGIIPRLYSVYYVETLDYIQRAGLIGETQAVLGAMLNIMPFLTIEAGALIPMEKVRTRSQAVDKMVEFVTEFNVIERLTILQNTLRVTDQTRMLQDRLMLDFPKLDYPIVLYEPLLSSWIGPDGMGVVVFEGEPELDD
jgi:DegV family protein with EDD domain